jgi:hypothetical protein
MIAAHFGHAAIAELSPVSGIRRKLDVEPAKGSFWRKAALGAHGRAAWVNPTCSNEKQLLHQWGLTDTLSATQL